MPTISLLQTADGALQVIDEKLIRMKEQAEQAATGTYSFDQRLMINREFQAMAAEIDRIAKATDFNGVHLLNGNLSGEHSGNGLTSTGALKVHFGPGNDSAEDYYYISLASATMNGLGMFPPEDEIRIASIADKLQNGVSDTYPSGIISFGYIPKGTTNLSILIDGFAGAEDDIQIFTRDGRHILGTPASDAAWWGDSPASVVSEENGFYVDATYTDALPGATTWAPPPIGAGANRFTYNDMNISYSGDYDSLLEGNDGSTDDGAPDSQEQVLIDEVTEDLIVIVSGRGIFSINATWDDIPGSQYSPPYDIITQSNAQEMLGKLDTVITIKDGVRADIGAMQNRLENTISNLQIQSENLQAAESRISDVDVSLEMTEFVRRQTLASSAVPCWPRPIPCRIP